MTNRQNQSEEITICEHSHMQGETLEELKENLIDIFNELNKYIIQG